MQNIIDIYLFLSLYVFVYVQISFSLMSGQLTKYVAMGSCWLRRRESHTQSALTHSGDPAAWEDEVGGAPLSVRRCVASDLLCSSITSPLYLGCVGLKYGMDHHIGRGGGVDGGGGGELLTNIQTICSKSVPFVAGHPRCHTQYAICTPH